ncbi:hypothetical protein DYB32_009583, partial [Aphanomyces invadans]
MSTSDLRDGWEHAVDPSTNHVFYFNRSTGETSWTKPAPNENIEWKARARIVLTNESAAVLIQKMWRARIARQHMQALMQSLYKRIFDPSTQEYFYYNAQTGQTSWTTPRGLKTKPHTSPNVSDETTGTALPLGWQESYDIATQRVYYVNESTGESSWTVPAMPSEESEPDDSVSISFEALSSAILIQAAWRGVLARDGLRKLFELVVGADGIATYLPFSPGHFRSADLGDAASDRSLNLSKRRLPRSKAQVRDAELDDIPVTQLNLSHLQMTAISGRVWNLDRLETLDLRGNKLDRIPSAIQDLTALVHTFSPKLWKLRGLLSLDLSYNLMADLPFVEGDLRLLRETSAWQVSIGLLTALTSLNLSNNNLVKCPALIDNCTALTTVDLSYNAIPSLETEFGNLRALETCYLQHNALVELPDSWGRLASLHTLDVSHNHLTSLPASVGNCTALAALDASYNDLSALPATIKSLSMLRRLDLSHNSALVFPNVLPALTSLETVVFDHCNLPDLPTNALAYTADMPLYSICLGANAITQLPLDMELLRKSLAVLRLDRNAIPA